MSIIKVSQIRQFSLDGIAELPNLSLYCKGYSRLIFKYSISNPTRNQSEKISVCTKASFSLYSCNFCFLVFYASLFEGELGNVAAKIHAVVMNVMAPAGQSGGLHE